MDVITNFRQFCIMMDMVFTVFNDLSFVFVAMVITIELSLLFKLRAKYSSGYQIFTNTNNVCQIVDREEFVHQVSDNKSAIVDNGARFDNLTKIVIIPIVMQYKAMYIGHANNLNDNYTNLHCANDQLIQYRVSMYGKLFSSVERDMVVHWNSIITLRIHLLNTTMKIQEILQNAKILILTKLFGDAIKTKQCDVQKFDLNNAVCFDSNNKTKDDFASTIVPALFKDDSITAHPLKATVEYLQDTAAIFHALFTNSTEYSSEKETKSAHYDGFNTMIRTLALTNINMFVLRLYC